METTTQLPSVQQTFNEHHRRLERLFEQLLATLRVGDSRECGLKWGTFERELTEHMALEEQMLFPRFGELEPAAAARLRAEHEELRRDLADLGAAVDLHGISEAAAKAFFDRLRAHAAREDALLYRWADRQVRDRRSLIERLRRISRHGLSVVA